jgi:hypothetical protein
MAAERERIFNLQTGFPKALVPLRRRAKFSVPGHSGDQPKIEVKTNRVDFIPGTIDAVFRDQHYPAVPKNPVCFIQKRSILCRMMKHIEQKDDIKTSGVYGQNLSIEHLERNVGLVGVNDIQTEDPALSSVPKELAQVTAPGTDIQYAGSNEN